MIELERSSLVSGRTTRRVLALATATVLAGAVWLGGGEASAASGGCKDASLSGESHIDLATGAFIGSGSLDLGNSSVEVEWISIVTSVTPHADGSLTLLGSHHITSVQGHSIDFTTSDVVTAVPNGQPGEYDFSSHLDVLQ